MIRYYKEMQNINQMILIIIISGAISFLFCCPKEYLNNQDKFQSYLNRCTDGYYDAIGMRIACIPESWIESRLSADSIRTYILVSKFKKTCNKYPCRKECNFWLEVDSLLGKNGYLCYFNSPKKYWDALAGRAGWVIEIDGKIVYVLVEIVN